MKEVVSKLICGVKSLSQIEEIWIFLIKSWIKYKKFHEFNKNLNNFPIQNKFMNISEKILVNKKIDWSYWKHYKADIDYFEKKKIS